MAPDSSARRLDTVVRHLSAGNPTAPPSFDLNAMQLFLDVHDLDFRKQLYDFMAADPLFQYKYDASMAEHRQTTWERAQKITRAGFFRGSLTKGRDLEAQKRYHAVTECLAAYDYSLSILTGVHFGLFGSAVLALGTSNHHRLLSSIECYDMPGCFALTELGHGSNVRGIETQATYDAGTKEFVIRTPTETAQKYWIGGSALHARFAVVFAQLTLGGELKGVHPFLVQIRNDDGSGVTGVRIADCGHKMGLNGVDNGRLWFDDVRVPRENLLDGIGQVSPAGEYTSKYKTADQRFGAMMLPLTGGRVSISMYSVNVCKIALATAIRYGAVRRAFGPPGEAEIPILDYQSHQVRLMPLLAATYAFNVAAVSLKMQFARRSPKDIKEIHVLSSGYKALASWLMSRTLQECREACGGQGYRSDSRFGPLRGDHDISLTFEGDNNVLLQQIAKALLGELKANPKAKDLLQTARVTTSTRDKRLVATFEFHTKVFAARRHELLRRLALKLHTLNPTSPKAEFYAWNECLDIAALLGRAHTELTVLHKFNDAIKAADGALQPVLRSLCTLFALNRIDEDPAFVRYHTIDGATAETVHDVVVALCGQVRAVAVRLVNAFGIPDFMLGKIAGDYIAYNSYSNLANQH